MTDPFDQSLHHVLERLKRSVEELNHPANLDGLLAAHFDVNSRLGREIGWRVYCDPLVWARQNEVNLHQEAPSLAIFGCLLSEQACRLGKVDDQAAGVFKSNLARLQQRQDVFSLPNSWALQADVVLGITLGIKAVSDPSSVTWMQGLLEEGFNRQDIPLLPRLIYSYASALLGGSLLHQTRSNIMVEPSKCSIAELVLAIWLAKRDILEVESWDRGEWLNDVHPKLVSRLIAEAPYEAKDYKAAIMWEVVCSYIEARSRYPTLDLVSALLQNFPAAMERWRSKWIVEDEYDVQSLLWLMLRTSFDELRYEENLPKLGRSGERYDIGIPQLGLIVEAKYARKASDFQKIVDDIGKDSVQLQPQSTFTSIIVFVYDESCSVEQHDWARRTLESIASVKRAIIVCAPSTCRLQRQNPKPG